MRKVQESLKSALQALGANKIRSFLTMLGVIIGVFAVVALVSLVKGLENFIISQFDAIGSNLIIVASGNASFGRDPATSFTKQNLQEKHVDIVKKAIEKDINGITPSIRVTGRLKYKNKTGAYSVTATNEEATKITNVEIEYGRYFNRAEVLSKAHVVVLGPAVKEDLFGSAPAVDKKITLADRTFTVIGVAKEGAVGASDRVYIPYTTAKEIYNLTSITNILVSAKNPEDVDSLMREIEIALVSDIKPDDFSVISQKDILKVVNSILTLVATLLGAIAGISLFVGGIGIMNIMLVTVTERTSEVGLRKALGATKLDIGIQFLLESAIISLSGGIIGLFIAWVTTLLIRDLIEAEITLWSALLSLGFSLFVGIVFGTYPALKAAKKDAIEALRSKQ